MKKKCRYVFLCVWLWMVGALSSLQAQPAGKFRVGHKTVETMSLVLDSLPLAPASFSVVGLEAGTYSVNEPAAVLTILDSNMLGRSISYSYRIVSFDFSQKIVHKSSELILSRFVADPAGQSLYALPSAAVGPLFDASLQGTGSVARSVSIGNNQDFVLDAHLNLQMAGQLAPDVEIVATITDENLPVQPEGNTRVLKDFNKIFIQLKYKDLLKVTAGDIELPALTESYFMKVNRQFLGMDLTASYKVNDKNRLTNVVGGGVSKGKYARNTLTPILGVQGPYRLYGAQNETSIVIIAGSERVYIDGVLLTRGQSNDYVIDYNTGEITFSTQHLIAPENRIVVEFEYSDRYYSRYNLYTYNEFEHEQNSHWKLNVDFFHEQDLKNHSLQPELSNEQMSFLSNIGDDRGAAYYPTASQVAGYTAGEVLYHRQDTVVNGRHYTPIYVYAGSSHDSVYRVAFSYVGAHKGNYVLSQSTVNGKLYAWVAPSNGIPQGDYEPVVQLNTPQMTDMLAVGASYKLRDVFALKTEWAMSYLDQNLFSRNDDADNVGMACQLHLTYQPRLRPKLLDCLWKYLLQLDYEYVHKNFNSLESFRNVEFARDYNLEDDYSRSTSEQMLKLSTGFVHPKNGSTLYVLNWLTRSHQLKAFRNELNSVHNFGRWSWNSQSSYLFSNDVAQRTRFLRTQNDVCYRWGKVKLGMKENLEYNVFRLPDSDSLRLNSYAFNEAVLYLQNGDSSKVNYSFSIKNRTDHDVRNNVLTMNAMSNEAKAAVEVSHWKHHRLRGVATYRNDRVRDSLQSFASEHNFIGSLDYAGRFLKGAIVLNLYYEAGSGLEQKKEYTFLKVAAGQGTHIWNDYNGNGMEELDEFEVAAFQNEADYVKVWLATNEYVSTYNCGTTQSLALHPAHLWQHKKGFLHFLSMWSNLTTLRTYQKNTLQNDIRSFNPYQFDLADSVLVSQTMNMKNNLAFTLPTQYFSAEYTFLKNQVKNLLYYGFESSDLAVHRLTLRSVPIKICVLECVYDRSMKENITQYLGSRNYRLLSHMVQQSITLRFKNNITTALSFEMSYRKNQYGMEKSNQYKVMYDFDYRMKEKGTISLKLQYINVLYNGMGDNSLSYEMLAGLTPGNNFLWNVAYQTRLFEYLQINLQYEGRMTNDKQLIHTGFLQMKAFF